MIEITPLALDQASNRVTEIWRRTRQLGPHGSEGEGLHSWLLRMAEEALQRGDVLSSGKIRSLGIKFGFLKMATQSSRGQSEGWLLQTVERIR